MKKWGVWLEHMVNGSDVPNVGLSKQKHVHKVADTGISLRGQPELDLSLDFDLI